MPTCSSPGQNGDNCEVCGAVYSPTDLKNPVSVLTGATPELRDSEHFFFKLSDPRCVEFLKGRKDINAAQIGLIGHSEGGIIAPLVASRSRDIAYIVLLAGTGVPGDEILYTQAAAILKVAGVGPEQLARQKELQKRIIAVVRQEKDNAAAEKKIRAAFEDLSSNLGQDDKKQLLEAMPMLEGQNTSEGRKKMSRA